MTDSIIAPPARLVPDEQSPHVRVIKDNTPDWYTEARDVRKTELASVDLRIPDWYKNASAVAKDRMRTVHLRSRTSLNQLDQMLGGLKPPAEYAEPLLVAAIEKNSDNGWTHKRCSMPARWRRQAASRGSQRS